MSIPIELSASLLSADFGRLKEEVETLDSLGVDRFHWDVMDGHFVPNITFGPGVIHALRPFTKRPFDVHLMIERADLYVEAFVEAGADVLIIHPESDVHLHRTLSKIKSLGIKAGVALNPSTSSTILDYVLDLLDTVLVMTVNPGFGGQVFLQSQVRKINEIRCKAPASLDIAVDGGIDPTTAPLAYGAGAKTFVAGSAIFKGGLYENNMEALRTSIG